jgi:HD superfamily phosphohydrolase
MGKEKFIRDPIYGVIEFPPWAVDLIDQPLFQRLRWVNQLALEQMVYPGGLHSRFEHSIGTMHLAGIAAESLIKFSRERKHSKLESVKQFKNQINTETKEKEFVNAAMAVWPYS